MVRDVTNQCKGPCTGTSAQVAAGTLKVPIGKTFRLDDIVEAHQCMDENRAGGKIVILP